MESIIFIDGYGELHNTTVDDEISDTEHKSTAPNRRSAAVISILILLAFLLAATGVVITPTTTNTESSSTGTQYISTDQPESTWNVTRFPISSLADLSPKPDPESLLIISLHISLDELKNLSSLPSTLISESNDPLTVSALLDCATLFDAAVSQLNDSIAAMGPGEVLTARKIRDLNSWISAAMTDQDTCIDGLEEMGSTVVDEVRMRVQRSRKCMSYTLALLASMPSLHLPLIEVCICNSLYM